MDFVNSTSSRYSKATDIERHYFSNLGTIYSDKISKFACEVIGSTNGLPIQRLEQIFDELFIDECQDLAGYDLELIEHLLKSDIKITLVGDARQATFTTHHSAKNKQHKGSNIVAKFHSWEKAGICRLEQHDRSYRCVQEICDFADQFFPDMPKTVSHNGHMTGHDGVFAIPESLIDEYISTFNPQPLRYDRRTKKAPPNSLNFGAAKGMTFERAIIFPHGPLAKFVKTGNLADAGSALSKIYVAITRARQSVAIVVPDKCHTTMIPLWKGTLSADLNHAN